MTRDPLKVLRVEETGEYSCRAVIGGHGASHYAFVFGVNELDARNRAEFLCYAASECESLKSEIAQLKAEVERRKRHEEDKDYECLWCGDFIPNGRPHWENCTKHPANARIAQLKDDLSGWGEMRDSMKKRIAELEQLTRNGPWCCYWCKLHVDEMSCEPKDHWEHCTKHPANKRIAELEADCIRLRAERVGAVERSINLEAELASLRPQFDVGETVEYRLGGKWHPSKIARFEPCYRLTCGSVRYENGIRKPQPEVPKVTKPTADEWYEAWKQNPDDRHGRMLDLAVRHKYSEGAGE